MGGPGRGGRVGWGIGRRDRGPPILMHRLATPFNPSETPDAPLARHRDVAIQGPQWCPFGLLRPHNLPARCLLLPLLAHACYAGRGGNRRPPAGGPLGRRHAATCLGSDRRCMPGIRYCGHRFPPPPRFCVCERARSAKYPPIPPAAALTRPPFPVRTPTSYLAAAAVAGKRARCGGGGGCRWRRCLTRPCLL